jgi:hypothetical protein
LFAGDPILTIAGHIVGIQLRERGR